MSDETAVQKSPSRRTLSWVLLELLGSMYLAITLLVVVAVASVIGTVLQQNQPYTDYVIKFGSFWFEVFRTLGLYDIYGTGWFIGILAFLILSTSVCIYRQTPIILREITRFRTQVQLHSLRGFHQRAEWTLSDRDLRSMLNEVTRLLKIGGYRWRIQDHGNHQVLAATKGRFNRLGYLFTHISIVVIGIGGLLDGNLWLKMKEWQGDLQIETRNLAASKIPAESRLKPSEIPAFRGHVMLPEGSAANFIFLRVRDGFVLQELPFAIELKDFNVSYYDTGQPKSFVSQVLIHDKEHLGDQPLEGTIRVNHPLMYRGYAIYQSDFGDGGSKLELRAWSLKGKKVESVETQGSVGNTLQVGGASNGLNLEIDEFRLFNLMPEPDAKLGDRKFRNFGPSVGFKLRNAAGQAREYVNYMVPSQLEGRWFYISGMRSQPNEPFIYLHIPIDAKNSIERFLNFNARLRDTQWLREQLTQTAPPVAGEGDASEFQRNLETVRLNLLELFLQGGFEAVTERAKEVVPTDRLENATTLYLNILRDTLAEIFITVLREEGINVEQDIGEKEEAFFNDAVSTLTMLPRYGSPFYLQLMGFEQVEASGLQVTYSGGTVIVYTGFVLLIIGVFIMFYTSHRRLWVWLAAEEGITRLLVAGTGNRRQAEFAHEFAGLQAALEQQLGSPEINITVPNSTKPSDLGTDQESSTV